MPENDFSPPVTPAAGASRGIEPAPVVLVTGATRGIGRAVAALLAGSGFRVFGTSRRPEETEPIPGVTLLPLDVTSAESIAACVASLMEAAGRIDALVNNAGTIGPGSAVEEIDIATVRQIFETNFFGLVQMTNAVLPHLRAQGGGTVVNISSASGRVALPPFFTFYAASKHALEAYTEGMRYEVAPFGIRVALIEPGYTDTGILESVRPPDHPIAAYAEPRAAMTMLNRAGIRYGSRPEQTAQAVLRVLASEHPAARRSALVQRADRLAPSDEQSASGIDRPAPRGDRSTHLDERPAYRGILPPLRYPVGFDSLAIGLLRRFLPATLFEALGRWMFLTWQPPRPLANTEIPTPRDLGLHRLLFHGPTLRAAYRAGLTAAALITLLAAKILHHRRRDS